MAEQRLIDANAFRRELDNHYPFTKYEQRKYGIADMAKSTVLYVLEKMPTIEERKTEKWIREGSAFNLRCPYCRQFFVEPIGSKFNFCPNCGMRGTP